MSHTSSIFSRTPIELPNRSGFDMSHENLGTQTCGTLVPVLVDELLPNDTISLGANFQVQLPPMATDFYGRVDYILEAFFVPARLLWGGWKSFMTHPTANPTYPVNTPVQGRSKYMPQIYLSGAESSDPDVSDTYAGSLADYLGMKDTYSNSDYFEVNALPFLAYHRIWDDWYRDSRIQAPVFYSPDSSVSASHLTGGADFPANPSYAPFVSGGVSSPFFYYGRAMERFGDFVNASSCRFVDGKSLCDLRQRNWSKDYFTTASPLPQAGNAATLEFDVNDDQGTFSIAALRSANSLQKWMERNNIMGYRYADQIYGQYGCYPSDAIMDKCLYLGRVSQNVYTRSVFQTAQGGDSSRNPFNGTGQKFGSSQSIGEGSLVDNIRVKEHGFLMVLASLVPHSYYSTGMRRYLKRSVVGDIAFPLLSGMGEQAIRQSELNGTLGSAGAIDGVFGYTDLYAEYKYHDDEVHGLLVDGQSLESFALQRGFGRGSDLETQLSSDFLQIPVDYMDQVYAVSNSASGFDCWYDIFFPYKKISTLPEYSIPTLGDLKNVHVKKVSRGGTRL